MGVIGKLASILAEITIRKSQERVRVILLAEEESTAANLIDQLLQHPIKLAEFKPLAREEIYEQSEAVPERCFVDTNIWLYAFIEGEDRQKTMYAKALLETSRAVIV